MKVPRRKFLRASDVALALPCLEAFAPARAATRETGPVRRMVCICAPLGLVATNFFPEKAGKDYELTSYLEL